jgi:hypothetical protein
LPTTQRSFNFATISSFHQNRSFRQDIIELQCASDHAEILTGRPSSHRVSLVCAWASASGASAATAETITITILRIFPPAYFFFATK